MLGSRADSFGDKPQGVPGNRGPDTLLQSCIGGQAPHQHSCLNGGKQPGPSCCSPPSPPSQARTAAKPIMATATLMSDPPLPLPALPPSAALTPDAGAHCR